MKKKKQPWSLFKPLPQRPIMGTVITLPSSKPPKKDLLPPGAGAVNPEAVWKKAAADAPSDQPDDK